MTRKAARRATARPEPVTAIVPDELAAFAADPELAAMFIADANDHLGNIEATVLKLEASPADLALVNDVFRPFHTIKGNAGVLGIGSIQEFAHKVETLLDLARSGTHAIGPTEIELILKAVDVLKLAVDQLPARAAGRPVADISTECRTLMERIDAAIAHPSSPPPDPSPPPAASPSEIRDDEPSTVKVQTKKLDDVVDMVGELAIALTILGEDPAIARIADDRVTRRLAHVKRIASDLQRDTMAMRMVPIRQTFQKMARLVRDLSHRFSKPCTLTLAGEDTELDRKVVELMTDPLMHMMRNAVDHGLEPPDERVAVGKSATAELRLTASHRGGCVIVDLADDGRGLDTDRILQTAVARGLVERGVTLTPAEIHELIFHPGFSTADRVTELSGRGVGMDVVRRNVEALRGRIEVQTARGRGTTFSIQLPLTLAIVDGIVLAVGSDRFVIPTFAVRESFRPQPGQLQTLQGRTSLVQVRDQLFPLLRLADVLGVQGARRAIADSTIVICHDNGRSLALAVDELLGKQEVVIKGLGEMFRTVRGIAGGAILGDGRIGLILDTGGLLALVAKAPAHAAA
ncbi:MAG TPA: chemotaxis protein CheA [Vicinamibacterales bacterium]|nr:chemotaxis protein CheA [Vicinamibacterales bacterium]